MPPEILAALQATQVRGVDMHIVRVHSVPPRPRRPKRSKRR
jgi:hypothetical protein